jgi:hypothetical protein
MTSIVILKNNQIIKTYITGGSDIQRTFDKAVDIAGGMWNGVDIFTVKIMESDLRGI